MRQLRGLAGLVAGCLLAGSATIAAGPDPIVVCLHTPITGANPIPHHPDRFGRFYFDYVNAEIGGVDGRPVHMFTIDDQSNPAGARRAAGQCRDQGAHLLLGYFGVEQIASVAGWAEEHQMPYLHASAPSAVVTDLEWSAFIGPTDELQMRELATAVLNSTSGPVQQGVAMIRVDSPPYEPGHRAFVDALADEGVTLAVDRAIQKDEGNFQDIWLEMRKRGVRYVNAHLTPNLLIRMLGQRPAGYDPTFLSVSSLVGTDLVAAGIRGLPMITFHDPSPTYDPRDQSLPWHDEIQEFQRIFRAYSPEQDPPMDDVDWHAYIRAKQVHRFLDALEGDLSPEHVRAAFSTYAETPEAAFPSCALDFATTPGEGSHAWHVFELENGRWHQKLFCNDGSTLDLSSPRIACTPAGPVTTGPGRCSIADAGSGIATYDIQHRGYPAIQHRAGHGECASEVEVSIDPPPGVHELVIQATNCAGALGSHQHRFIAAPH